MATRKTFVKFKDVLPLSDARYRRIEVQTLRDDCLGYIDWYPRWRQYIFEPDWDTVFSFDCLQGIAARVQSLTAELKQPATVSPS
jgi:hypothetical protein